jgi:phosphoribosylanthranilate isomerase
MVRVKICGITNLSDALMSVEAGADVLGFNFWRGSARYIEPQTARGIIEQLPRGVLSVGVFVNEDEPEAVVRKAEQSGVGAVQLHGDETPAFCRALEGRQVIKALRVAGSFKPEDVLTYETGAVLLDAFCVAARGGTGRTFDWKIARRVRALVSQLYLAGGLTPLNVAEAIAAVGPYAVDVCSGVESAPGRKDATRVREFVEAVRRAETASADG